MNSDHKTKDWRGLGYLLPAGIAMAWLVSKAKWFWQHNPELQFGWIVLLLAAYLFWEAWESRPAYRWQWRISSGFCLALGIALLFLTQLYQSAYGLTAASL